MDTQCHICIVSVVAMVSKDASGKLKAGDWVKEPLALLGGKGGGSPVQAQGQGAETSKLPEVVKIAETLGKAAFA